MKQFYEVTNIKHPPTYKIGEIIPEKRFGGTRNDQINRGRGSAQTYAPNRFSRLYECDDSNTVLSIELTTLYYTPLSAVFLTE